MLSRLISALMLAIVSHSAFAAELFMYRREGCSWCLAWDREIGPIYGKTPVGQRMGRPEELAAVIALPMPKLAA